MGEKEMSSVVETGRIQSRSGKTYFAESSHISRSSGANANKFSLLEEKKFFVEFRIKNEVEVHGPRVVESLYGRIGQGVEYWIDEGRYIDADIISYGMLP
jgi:hypothetical protein